MKLKLEVLCLTYQILKTFVRTNDGNFFFFLGKNLKKLVWNGKNVNVMESKKIEIGNDEYDLTPDNQSAIPSPKYVINNLNEDVLLTFENIIRSVNFIVFFVKHGEKKSMRMKSTKNQLENRIH